MRRPLLSPRLAGLGTTIFAEMSALAVETGAINLGQGFPDEDGPIEVADAAIAAIRGGGEPVPARSGHRRAPHRHRPAPSPLLGDGRRPGHRGAGDGRRHRGDRRHRAGALRSGRRDHRLRADLRLLHGRRGHGRCAPEAGDASPAPVRGGHRRARGAPERPNAACSSSTRRTTPPARCSPSPELEAIARVCVEHDLIAVTDEVYEHLVFDGEHRPLATFPGMADRTLTISSAARPSASPAGRSGGCAAPRSW